MPEGCREFGAQGRARKFAATHSCGSMGQHTERQVTKIQDTKLILCPRHAQQEIGRTVWFLWFCVREREREGESSGPCVGEGQRQRENRENRKQAPCPVRSPT